VVLDLIQVQIRVQLWKNAGRLEAVVDQVLLDWMQVMEVVVQGPLVAMAEMEL